MKKLKLHVLRLIAVENNLVAAMGLENCRATSWTRFRRWLVITVWPNHPWTIIQPYIHQIASQEIIQNLSSITNLLTWDQWNQSTIMRQRRISLMFWTTKEPQAHSKNKCPGRYRILTVGTQTLIRSNKNRLPEIPVPDSEPFRKQERMISK